MDIKTLYQYSVENNRLYRELYANMQDVSHTDWCFQKLPVVDKKIYQQYASSAVSVPYSQYPLSDSMTVVRSSGSTGQYLKIHWDKRDRVNSLYCAWKWRRRNYSVHPKEKFADFYSAQYINNRFIDDNPDILEENSRHVSFSKLGMNSSKVDKYIDYICKFSPAWLMTQPSVLMLLTKRLRERKLFLPPSVKYIELTGEYISGDNQKYLSQFYGVNIANCYGCNEVNYIACECPCGNLHVLNENVYVEILKDGKPVKENSYGDIVVTGLHNHAMPMIRYNTGDTGSLNFSHSCPCGSTAPILKLANSGRCYSIKTSSEVFCSTELTYAVEKVNELLNNSILQYQVVQKTETDFEVYFVLKHEYENWKDAIRKSFIESIPSIDLRRKRWSFFFKDNIYPSKTTGKVSYFVSEI